MQVFNECNTDDYWRHALLHGRSNYCHSLSIVVEQCDLLPIIVSTRCSTVNQITVTYCRLLSNNETYCRLLSPRVAPRPIKLLSFTVDCCRKMRLTADYCRHALLQGRIKCHSLSIFVDYYRHARFSSVRSVFRRNKTLDSSV